jgi:hypothetical protein
MWLGHCSSDDAALLDSGDQETGNGGAGMGGSTCSFRWTTVWNRTQNGSSQRGLWTDAW